MSSSNAVVWPFNPPKLETPFHKQPLTDDELDGLVAAVREAEYEQKKDRDTGELAREVLMAKLQKANKRHKRVHLFVAMFFLAVSLLIYGASTQVVTAYDGYYKKCAVMLGDEPVTATRQFRFKYYDLFGFRLWNGNITHEETRFDLKFRSMIIVGMGDGELWRRTVGKGEGGEFIAKPANNYMLLSDNHTVMVNSKTFCR